MVSIDAVYLLTLLPFTPKLDPISLGMDATLLDVCEMQS